MDHPWAGKDWESVLFRLAVIMLTGYCYAEGVNG